MTRKIAKHKYDFKHYGRLPELSGTKKRENKKEEF